jgi:formylglycine-generating enzyme required for sulfatase activity
MRLVLIPRGAFTMGSPKDEKDRSPDEERHEVEITKPFYLGVYTVTQAQFKEVTGKNPSAFSATGWGKGKVKGLDTGDFPVECVSWHDAARFCARLSALPAERGAGRKYRLPTEAEWEYACRAGTTTRYNCGEALSKRQAHVGEPQGRTCKVGSYKPKCVGPLRHARQRLPVVLRLVSEGLP